DAADHDGQQGAETDHQTHGWKVDGFHFRQVDRILAVFFTVVTKKTQHTRLLHEGFDHPDAAIRFLGIGGEVTQQSLNVFAAFVNDRIDVINGNGKDRQWCQHIEAQQRVLPDHEKQAEPDGHEQVGEVHDRWTGKHTDAADVLRHPAHQVTGAMGLVKIGIQLLVMIVYLFFLIVLDMTAHHNDGLSHEEKKAPADQRQHKECNAANDDLLVERRVPRVHFSDEFPDQDIVI